MAKLKLAYYITQDMDRAVAFYRDALKLKLKFQDGARWAQFDVGGTSLALSSPAEAQEGAVGGTAMIEIEDLDGARAGIVKAGGTILGERAVTGGRSLAFRDPDGNIVQLFERAVGGA
jgi:predicted enzyme related to lactoylglutathione lyase